MTIVDCEHHVLVDGLEDLSPYLSDAWRERLAMGEFSMPRPSPHPGAELEARSPDRGSDPAAAVAALDPGVTQALLIPAQPLVVSGWLGHSMADVFCRAVNDFVVDTWLPADPRLHFAIAVSAHDGEAAAAEVRRLGASPRAAAVCLSAIAVNMGQKHYHPIYAAAEELGLPVIVHPGGFEGNVVGPAVLGGVGPRTPEETFSLLPQVAMTNLASLIYDGIFVSYPRLKVVFAGFGFAWAPPVVWRLDAEWRGLRIEVPWVVKPPSEYIAEHVRFVVDGACELDHPEVWQLAEMLGEDALLWGSDEPFRTSDPAPVLAAAPQRLRDGLAAANARNTFPALAQESTHA